MKKSIMTQEQDRCYICGGGPVQRHHVMHGTANRSLADEDGLWVPLCLYHHTGGPEAVHNRPTFDRWLKEQGQAAYEREHSRAEFMARYGKSYL